MGPGRFVPALVAGLATVMPARSGQAQSGAWLDPSPHAVLRVAVTPDVRLEVLDWGGRGPAIVFLPGLGNTAHSFDDFALRFRADHRVYAITPRGFGASSQPSGGYDSATRARDILAVLDTLHIDRAILVGHSIAGDELSRFAVRYPGRVRALVYLDAYSYGSDSPQELPWPAQAGAGPMTPAESASVNGVSDYWLRTKGVRPPEAELRQVSRFTADGRMAALVLPFAAAEVLEGTTRSEYGRIRAPALGIFAPHSSVLRLFPRYAAFDGKNRRMADASFAGLARWQQAQVTRFRTQLRRGEVVEIPDADHYVHYSHADAVEHEVRAFLRRVAPAMLTEADAAPPPR